MIDLNMFVWKSYAYSHVCLNLFMLTFLPCFIFSALDVI